MGVVPGITIKAIGDIKCASQEDMDDALFYYKRQGDKAIGVEYDPVSVRAPREGGAACLARGGGGAPRRAAVAYVDILFGGDASCPSGCCLSFARARIATAL